MNLDINLNILGNSHILLDIMGLDILGIANSL